MRKVSILLNTFQHILTLWYQPAMSAGQSPAPKNDSEGEDDSDHIVYKGSIKRGKAPAKANVLPGDPKRWATTPSCESIKEPAIGTSPASTASPPEKFGRGDSVSIPSMRSSSSVQFRQVAKYQ